MIAAVRTKKRRGMVRARPAARMNPAPQAGSRARSPLRTTTVLIAISLLLVFAWQSTGSYRARGGESRIQAQLLPIPLDSVTAAARVFDAATARGDWPEALRWQRRIAAALPSNPIALRQLGQALHNHRNAVVLPDGRTGWLLRNSIIRAQWEVEALALFDSSGVVTTDPSDQALAHYWKGRSAEYEELPLDARTEYEAALALAPLDPNLQQLCKVQRQHLLEVMR